MGPIGCVLGLVGQIIQLAVLIVAAPIGLIVGLIAMLFGRGDD